MKQSTFANRWNADIIDQNYDLWKENPEALDADWQAFYEGFELALNGHTNGAEASQPAIAQSSGELAPPLNVFEFARKQARFTGMIYAFRSIGHTQANYNPLFVEAPKNPRLKLRRLGFEKTELEERYSTGNYLGDQRMSVAELFDKLTRTYCSSIGVEYLHIQETPRRRWLQSKMEPILNHPNFSKDIKLRALDKIVQAEAFEKFLHTRYVGQKRFGLEGGESVIAALDHLIEIGPSTGVEEIVMGMAHRGRLNVLANILGKSYEYIFHEFSENYIPETTHGDGDVKYHLGFDAIVQNSRQESMVVQLAANPSHLEAVNSVVEGRVRARQRILGDTENRSRVIPLLIHGDAAFAGQGVVAEVLNFSQLQGYTTGGTLHYVINNQIGFTTDPSEARSSLYCTDIAKMIEAPIFHVNGDDPLALLWVSELALKYRQEFRCDVVIDVYCYRRHGHNESDEPAFTQPLLYRQIKNHPLISETYSKKLHKSGDLTSEEEEKLRDKHLKILDTAFERTKKAEEKDNGRAVFKGSTAVYQPDYSFGPFNTAVSRVNLNKAAEALYKLPESFKANPKIARLFKSRAKAYEEDSGIDWGFAEQLAWGTLMLEGTPVRLSGQDSARGTFSHRHAVLVDVESKKHFMPLMDNLPDKKARLCVHNSLLSEAAVLGFDYGYSLDYPQMLCMWEAQFGDFVNGAQVVIDQFITSSESKWQRISGLVMLLPHGYEGQGPEHSSARLERFLQACAEDNIEVANLTSPAQYFHILRRQMRRNFRKPLVIMSPKSLLRHKECTSKLSDFTDSGFSYILDDNEPARKTDRLVFCSGKVYFDLIRYRRDNKIKDTSIIRIEQYYPFDTKSFDSIFSKYEGLKEIVWCQEEPHNMGAWTFIKPILTDLTKMKPRYAGRQPSASPAVGSLHIHKLEQEQLVKSAFGD